MATEDQRLAPLRARIDAIDAEILELLSTRAKAAQEVGHVKGDFVSPVFRPERERQVVANLLKNNPGPLLEDGIAAIWREIMSACRALEARQTIAYLGPVGTFSELAAQTYFGQSTKCNKRIINSIFSLFSKKLFFWHWCFLQNELF
jgi:chorismate mutase/prephenate dehydratase